LTGRAAENGSGFRVPARLRLATAAAAAVANSLSGAAALLFRDRLGVKPVRIAGPSRKALRKRAGVVLSTGIAGSCSSGLGSKSSGNLRLRLELVGAGGETSIRVGGVCEVEVGTRLRADDGVATIIGTGGALEERGLGVEFARSAVILASEGSLLLGPLEVGRRGVNVWPISNADFDLIISGVE